MKQNSTKHAVAIRHVHFEDLGTFELLLKDSGFEVTYVDVGTDPVEYIERGDPDLLVVLGGPIGAYEEHLYPFLTDEISLIERRLARGAATLGICLGSQLMARALGAKVYAGHGKEIGWSPLELTEAGYESCLRHFAKEKSPVLHWHGDTFDLPENAVRLASTPMYPNQAFSWGKNALALQFHAEVEPLNLERWYIGHACELASAPWISVAQLRADTKLFGDALVHQSLPFFADWLAQIRK